MRDALKSTKAADEATAAKNEGVGSDAGPGETGDVIADGPRERLLTAAAKLFARRGYGNVTVRNITNEAGTNMAMVSYYFGGRDGLYCEVLDRIFGIIDMSIAPGRGLPPLERVSFYARSLDALHSRYREIAPIIPLFQKIEQVGKQKNVQNWTSGGAVTSVFYRQVTKE